MRSVGYEGAQQTFRILRQEGVHMLRRIAPLLAILALTPALVVQAGQPEPLVEYPNFPFQAGWTWVAGELSLGGPCEGKTFYVYSGEDTSGELLGSGKAWTDWKGGRADFVVYLSRPLKEGEVITIYAECEEGKVVWDTSTVEPFESWPKPLYIWSPQYYVPSIMLAFPTPGGTIVKG
ncbi:MAG: hypothetical protein J7M34_05870, partial [Anaerolineae bacterium]|nr:hypothetical protein [Anaerolineae bacterium]